MVLPPLEENSLNFTQKYTFFLLYSKKTLTFATLFKKAGRFQSGQMGQTVNLLSLDFGGSNPSLPTIPVTCKGRRYLFFIY